MAISSSLQGYKLQFLDFVPEDLYCKQCALVARELTITDCCSASYCSGCIHSILEASRPCPACEREDFKVFPHRKCQNIILKLKIVCPFKEKGCGWCGRLEQLDTHLDPEEGDCDHADIHCPLKCDELIDRKKITHHTANECVKRDYICPYCSFKAIYEIVINIHWPECSYYPLPCPNRCGVTCERPTMEDHIKICPLQEVECEFQHVGCEAKFRREDEEEHMKEKSQTHLTMMAKMNQELQTKIHEQKERLDEQDQKFEKQEQKAQEQANKLQEQGEQLKEQEKKLKELFKLKEDLKHSIEEELHLLKGALEKNIQDQQKNFEELKKGAAKPKPQVVYVPKVPQKFTLFNYKDEKWDIWNSPLMYTHDHGYKFCVRIDPTKVDCTLLALRGEYDDELKWPAKARFRIELINHYPNGDNKVVTPLVTWKRPTKDYVVMETDSSTDFAFSSRLCLDDERQTHYLKGDALYFSVAGITFFS